MPPAHVQSPVRVAEGQEWVDMYMCEDEDEDEDENENMEGWI